MAEYHMYPRNRQDEPRPVWCAIRRRDGELPMPAQAFSGFEPTEPVQNEEYQSFNKGQIIFKEGDPGDQLYIVAQGQVDILFQGQLLETVEPGGILGEMALIDDAPRSAMVIARSDCVLTRISRQHFLTLVQRTPAFALQVMRIMAQRLRRANARRPSE